MKDSDAIGRLGGILGVIVGFSLIAYIAWLFLIQPVLNQFATGRRWRSHDGIVCRAMAGGEIQRRNPNWQDVGGERFPGTPAPQRYKDDHWYTDGPAAHLDRRSCTSSESSADDVEPR